MKVNAKFKLAEHHEISWGYADHVGHKFVFRPEYDDRIPEDKRFHKATPSGEMSIMVDNPPVVEFWKSQIGKQFYLDFTPVD